MFYILVASFLFNIIQFQTFSFPFFKTHFQTQHRELDCLVVILISNICPHSAQRATVQWRLFLTGTLTSPSTWWMTTLPGWRARSLLPLISVRSLSLGAVLYMSYRSAAAAYSTSLELAVTFLFSCLPSDVKFDAVSGDYYPIVYFNDYWNLQKDYYPINDTLTTVPLRLAYCPISLWRWQLYAAQNARSPWNFLPEDTYEQSDEDQDSVKVRKHSSCDRWTSVG